MKNPLGFRSFVFCVCVCIIEWFNEAKCENIRFLLNDVRPKFFHISFSPHFSCHSATNKTLRSLHEYAIMHMLSALIWILNILYTVSIEHATTKRKKEREEKHNHMTTTNWIWDKKKLNKWNGTEWASTKRASHSHRIHNFSFNFVFLRIFHKILFIFLLKNRLWSRITCSEQTKKAN